MRSSSVPSREAARDRAAGFTEGERSFRNAKLGDLGLVTYKAAADLAGKASIFFLTIVAARRLSPDAFGVFALGTTVGWILTVATDFGVQMHVARAVAREPIHAAAILRRWWRMRVISSAAGLGLLAASLLALGVRGDVARAVLLFACAYTAAGLVEFLNYFYRGLSRSDIESTLTIGQRGATLVLGVAALVWTSNVSALAAAMLVPSAAALVWSALFALRVVPGTAAAAIPLRDSFARDVFPIGLGIVLSALYFRIDVLLVQAWAGTAAVAAYNAVFRIIDALRLFPAAALAVALPALSRAADLRPLGRIALKLTAFGVAAAAILWLAADPLVTLTFGRRYESAVPAFRILLLSLPFLSLNFALTHQLVGWGRQRAYATVCAIALAVNLALNAWMIPALSIDGAAWATLGTEICLTAGCAAALFTPGAPPPGTLRVRA